MKLTGFRKRFELGQLRAKERLAAGHAMQWEMSKLLDISTRGPLRLD
jgi:hypothetical protein